MQQLFLRSEPSSLALGSCRSSTLTDYDNSDNVISVWPACPSGIACIIQEARDVFYVSHRL